MPAFIALAPGSAHAHSQERHPVGGYRAHRAKYGRLVVGAAVRAIGIE
jgi:hypothetical protein